MAVAQLIVTIAIFVDKNPAILKENTRVARKKAAQCEAFDEGDGEVAVDCYAAWRP